MVEYINKTKKQTKEYNRLINKLNFISGWLMKNQGKILAFDKSQERLGRLSAGMNRLSIDIVNLFFSANIRRQKVSNQYFAGEKKVS